MLKLNRKFIAEFIVSFLLLLSASNFAIGQDDSSAKGKSLYEQVKSFTLSGNTAQVSGVQLKRDRVEMTFDGTFYFTTLVDGRVVGAVFIGQGKFRAEVPPSDFEKDNVKRLLDADVVESDFKTAVLRFSDDTFDVIGKNSKFAETVNAQAQKLAIETDERILKETGANLSARITTSSLNGEKPGLFFATFDGGKRERFSYLMDHQNRIPVANFDLNGGEKGLIFAHRPVIGGNDLWMAFYAVEDYQRGTVDYSGVNDLIDITHYKIDVDARAPNKSLKVITNVAFQTLAKNLRAIPFQVGESLGSYSNTRLKKQLRVKSVKLGGSDLVSVQEDWEGGFALFLPRAIQSGEKLEIEIMLEGDFMIDSSIVSNCFYPASNTTWYPRHGFLDRSTYEFSYRHKKSLNIASVGLRTGTESDPQNKDLVITKSKIEYPVALVTFALGPFERHSQTVKWDKGGTPIPLEFNSLAGSYLPIKEDFILAELDNTLRFFHAMFGDYPYPVFSAAVHPFGFGQGLPTLLMIPPTDRASKYTYSFIAHETSHQWWGNIVAWRSYRDQWLSEGFAEYSGVLYTGFRDGKGSREDLINMLRRSLKEPPVTTTGVGKGRLVDVGPMILGHRVNTSKTYGAYQALIYNKGALTLRMLHFLMSNPSTGDDKPFYDMMTDFVNRFRNNYASTDDFRAVANEHFAKTPIAQKYRLKDLNWFFAQWVYKTELPSYQLEYQLVDQPDGSTLVKGFVTQENVPEGWFMPLPLTFTFNNNQEARGTVHAYGAKTPFEIKLPMKPKKVELDPQKWILSEKTSTKG